MVFTNKKKKNNNNTVQKELNTKVKLNNFKLSFSCCYKSENTAIFSNLRNFHQIYFVLKDDASVKYRS